jgi:hypothetical protein
MKHNSLDTEWRGPVPDRGFRIKGAWKKKRGGDRKKRKKGGWKGETEEGLK